MIKYFFSFLEKIALISLIFIFTILMLYLPAFASTKAGLTKNIEIETKDKIMIEGIIELPKSATTKNKAPLVIMLHSIGGNKEIYNPFVEELRKRGIASVRIDLRGHGQSIGNSVNSKKTYWQQYSSKTFKKYPDDILTVLNFVKENFQQVNTNKTAIIAADISANASIIAANNKIKTLVLISPCLDYQGLKTPIKLVNYG
ncbi:MAG: alpha/beta hydrolase, partial [Candidatus Gastranaerophilaceae bacterium]